MRLVESLLLPNAIITGVQLSGSEVTEPFEKDIWKIFPL